MRGPVCRHRLAGIVADVRHAFVPTCGAAGRRDARDWDRERSAAERQTPGRDDGGSGAPVGARRPGPRLAAGLAARPARHITALASRGVPRALAMAVATWSGPLAAPGRDRPPDSAHGGREPAAGRRTYPRRAVEAGTPRRRADDPDLPAHRAGPAPARAVMGGLPTQSRRRDLALRLPVDHRPPISTPVCFHCHRPWFAAGHPCWRDAAPNRRLGHPAAARGHAVRRHPSSSFATTTASTGRNSTGLPPRARSEYCARQSARRGPTPSASGSLGACGASAPTICSSSASASTPVCCASTWCTSTGSDHTGAWDRRRRSRHPPR